MSHDPIADRMIDALRRQGARVSLDLADAIRAGVRNARNDAPTVIALAAALTALRTNPAPTR